MEQNACMLNLIDFNILHLILSWLGLKDIVVMDSALCDAASRREFHSAVKLLSFYQLSRQLSAYGRKNLLGKQWYYWAYTRQLVHGDSPQLTLPNRLSPRHASTLRNVRSVDISYTLGFTWSVSQMLTAVHVQCNYIGTCGMIAVVHSLANSHNLKEIKVCFEHMGNDGIMAIANGFVNWPLLEVLNVSNNEIGVSGITYCAARLVNLPNLKSFKGNCNRFIDIGVPPLVMGLQFTHVTELNLEGNRLGNNGTVALAMGLVHIPHLEELCLHENSIGTRGALSLALHLSNVPKLKVLDLSYNKIGLKGGEELRKVTKVMKEEKHNIYLSLHANKLPYYFRFR